MNIFRKNFFYLLLTAGVFFTPSTQAIPPLIASAFTKLGAALSVVAATIGHANCASAAAGFTANVTNTENNVEEYVQSNALGLAGSAIAYFYFKNGASTPTLQPMAIGYLSGIILAIITRQSVKSFREALALRLARESHRLDKHVHYYNDTMPGQSNVNIRYATDY